MTSLAPTADVPNPQQPTTLNWQWSVDAVKAALAASGTPPNLEIQQMMNAAFAVDGPAITAQIFTVMMQDRIQEINAEPLSLDVSQVDAVLLDGTFLLMLLTGRTDLLAAIRTIRRALDVPDVPEVPEQTSLELVP